MSKQEIRKIYRTAQKEDYPESLRLVLGGRVIEYSKVRWKVNGQDRGLRYGTNPHQKAALYRPASQESFGIGNVEWVKWGKDGPSATNIEDGSHGLRIVRYFDRAAAAVLKHLNPSGVAVQTTNEAFQEIYKRARDADPRASFGSVVVLNRPVDKSTAEELAKTFVEVVYAPSYDELAVKILDAKKDVRLGRVTLNPSSYDPDIVVLDDGSLILEDSYSTKIRSMEDVHALSVPTTRRPSDAEYRDLLDSWWIACEARSNAVVFWKNGVTLAVGTGQQDRIGAIEGCIEKAHRYGHDLKGSVMASDGFLPKVDNVESIAKEGVSAIIQPGGSVEDHDIIDACNNQRISMVLTGERSFRHF